MDFFISYTHAKWATWVTDRLEEAGYTTIVQARDFRPGQNFVSLMQDALRNAHHTIALLSPQYMESAYTEAKWTAAFTHERRGHDRALIPVIVEQCDVNGLLGPIIHIDLTNCDAQESRRRLLDCVQSDTKKIDSSERRFQVD